MAKRRKTFTPKDEASIVRQDSEASEGTVEVQNETTSVGSTTSLKDDGKMKLIALAGIIALIVAAFFIYKYAFKNPKEKAAANAIYKAEAQFARDSFALALENPGGGFDGFLDVIDKYNGTKAGNLAKYYAGVSYLNLGRHKDAISYLEAYKAHDEVTSITKWGALGDAYAEDGNLDKAVSLYEKAAATEDNDFLSPYYWKKAGMLHQRNNNNAAALAAYTKIKEKYGESSQGADIDRFIAQVQ